MSENTKIEWADHTFNPWIGCTAISPGCTNCYASDWAKRYGKDFASRTRTKTWGDPVRWNKQHEAFFSEHGRRQRVFCASLADVFDNEVDPQWRQDLFVLIENTPNLDWLILTKRIGNAKTMLHDAGTRQWHDGIHYWDEEPWPNVWIGATIVNQTEADRDIPKLLAVPAAKRFLSMEPLLGPVDLDTVARNPCENALVYPITMDPETGAYECCRRCDFTGLSDEWGIDWVIVGGESGPNARPMHPDWVRSLRAQCQAAGVPFLFKQWGEFLPAGANEADPAVLDVPDSRLVWSDGEKWDRFDGQRAGVDLVARVGKKAAGRLLDGQEWNGVPA